MGISMIFGGFTSNNWGFSMGILVECHWFFKAKKGQESDLT